MNRQNRNQQQQEDQQDDEEQQQQQQPRQARNRIRGPTSALTSFLREHGIRVENRSRIDRRAERAQREQEAADNSTPATPPDDSSTDNNDSPTASPSQSSSSAVTPEPSTTTTSILYAPARRTRRLNAAATQLIETARASSSTACGSSSSSISSSKGAANNGKRKKKPSDSDSDDDYLSGSDTDNDPGPFSRAPRPSRRNQIVFCDKCKGRFARPLVSGTDIETENVCPSCLRGDGPNRKTQKRSAKKRRTNGGGLDYGRDKAPSLQDICIKVVAQNIEDVEAFGEIGPENLDKLAKIISKNRKLTAQTARLFLEPTVRDLALYDCTDVDETGLLNVAHFCPNLKSLKLLYCGQMTSNVLATYSTRLKNLKYIELSGPYLVMPDVWIDLIKSAGAKLEGFKLSHSFRFNRDCLEALAEHCPNIKYLELSKINLFRDDWFDLIGKFDKLTTLKLAWPPEPKKQKISSEAIVRVLKAAGQNLTELALPGLSKVSDSVLLKGILGNCPNLKDLDLCKCENITSGAVQKLFNEWKTSIPGCGLERLNISRCVALDDEALKAILLHSGRTLKDIDLHSLDNLSAYGLEMIAGKFAKDVAGGKACEALATLNCSFVRSMDDFVLKLLLEACTSLQNLKVWGCNQLTNQIAPTKVRVIGREAEH
ncbi:hypothetical protein BDB00DRAFT_867489 [Zychaea mexicana]|uniref:uncharacterized protein n=1 Tax=Zychaea mexicana TaxID=64656 RepID=UPI0022FED2C9|nr:uncharacterized protein BDB00DRAFT_867489 [Zychaea mexicana]KAI9498330.1 hypothetical protein BDB00DRAFT_867489 [Zychaea mexicana]